MYFVVAYVFGARRFIREIFYCLQHLYTTPTFCKWCMYHLCTDWTWFMHLFAATLITCSSNVIR